jgi:NAD(P)-dependent dehydrogenase (short-subunit alcohol dehydrogenase family)
MRAPIMTNPRKRTPSAGPPVGPLVLIAATAAAWIAAGAILSNARRFEFRGRTVLITGGSRGLGLVLARRLGREGARVAICARNRDELERARSTLAGEGANVLALDCDVTDRDAVMQMVQAVQNVWGPVEVLINNAGAVHMGPQQAMTLDDYREAMAVHFWGPLHTMLAVLPGMRENGRGRIVNITSFGGKIALPHLVPYCASKFALVGLSEGLRIELHKEGIYVTTVCPGLMRTGSAPHALFKGNNEAEFAWFSVAGSAPLTSMSAERAAGQILRACRYGRAHVVLSLPARLGVLFHGVAPGVTANALSLIDRLMPGTNGAGTEAVPGARSRPAWLPEWTTWLGNRSAARNNQLPPD